MADKDHIDIHKWIPLGRLAQLSGVPKQRIRFFVQTGMPYLSSGRRTYVRYTDLERHVTTHSRQAAIIPASERTFLLELMQ